MSKPPLINLDSQTFNFARRHRSLKYAVQITHGGQVVKCITVSLEVGASTPPPVLKQQLTRKIIEFISNTYPGYVGMSGVILGRIDIEI